MGKRNPTLPGNTGVHLGPGSKTIRGPLAHQAGSLDSRGRKKRTASGGRGFDMVKQETWRRPKAIGERGHTELEEEKRLKKRGGRGTIIPSQWLAERERR